MRKPAREPIERDGVDSVPFADIVVVPVAPKEAALAATFFEKKFEDDAFANVALFVTTSAYVVDASDIAPVDVE